MNLIEHEHTLIEAPDLADRILRLQEARHCILSVDREVSRLRDRHHGKPATYRISTMTAEGE